VFEIYAAALCQRKTGRTYQIGPGATHALTTMSSARNERVGHQHHDFHFRVHCGHSVDIANENWTTGMRTDRGAAGRTLGVGMVDIACVLSYE